MLHLQITIGQTGTMADHRVRNAPIYALREIPEVKTGSLTYSFVDAVGGSAPIVVLPLVVRIDEVDRKRHPVISAVEQALCARAVAAIRKALKDQVIAVREIELAS